MAIELKNVLLRVARKKYRLAFLNILNSSSIKNIDNNNTKY